MLDIKDEEIGGARVRRTFTIGDRRLYANEYLKEEEVLAIPVANRRALVDSNFLEVYPKYKIPRMERFIVGVGKNQFNVIEGFVINDEPVSREEADKLKQL